MNNTIEYIAEKLMPTHWSYKEITSLTLHLLNDILAELTTTNYSWHPYGFLQIRFHSDRLWNDERKTVRLHIWPASTRSRQIPNWPIHNHAYNLYSTILTGAITNEVYNVIEDNKEQPLNKLYTARYKGNFSFLEATNNKVSYTKTSQATYFSGQQYLIPIHSYHVANVDEGTFASTIVLTTDSSDLTQYVVGDFNGDDVYSYERIACSKQEFYLLLTHLMETLNQANLQ